MLASFPMITTIQACQRIIQDYCEQCKLEVFLYLCRLNYVGHARVNINLNTLEVCSQISSVKQVYCTNGRVIHYTPDELFDKYSRLALSLPDDASSWSIQLCSCYLTALSKDLVDDLTSDLKLSIPDLTKLTTKALQLDALRIIRQHAVSSFKKLIKKKTP